MLLGVGAVKSTWFGMTWPSITWPSILLARGDGCEHIYSTGPCHSLSPGLIVSLTGGCVGVVSKGQNEDVAVISTEVILFGDRCAPHHNELGFFFDR